MSNVKYRHLYVALAVGLLLSGCPSKKTDPEAAFCGMSLEQVHGVRLEKTQPVPVIRVEQFPASFMIGNRLSPGDKTCKFDLVGPEVRPDRIFFRHGSATVYNRGMLESSDKDRVRISYLIRNHSYGLVLIEPKAVAPDDSGKFSRNGLNFEVHGGAFMRLEKSIPLVRSLGPDTKVRIHNPSKGKLPVQLLIDNTSERLSTPRSHGPIKAERIGPLTLRVGGTLGPGQKASLELAPRELKRPFSFIFGGDVKQETPIYVRLLKQVQAKSDPLFMLTIGDYTRNCLPWEYQAYFKTMEEVPFPVYYVKGNHETHCQGDIHYRRLFAPGRFTFQVADLLFVVLDSNRQTNSGYRLGKEQLDWLDRILSDHAKLPWKLLALHTPPHPLHTSPKDAPFLYNLDQQDGQRLKNLAKKHHVSYVLSGHAHLFARKVEDSVVYLTSGGAGAGLYSYNSLPGFSISLENHLMVMHVMEDSIEEERINLPPQSK